MFHQAVQNDRNILLLGLLNNPAIDDGLVRKRYIHLGPVGGVFSYDGDGVLYHI